MKRDAYSKDMDLARRLHPDPWDDSDLINDAGKGGAAIKRLVRRCRVSERTIALYDRLVGERTEEAAALRNVLRDMIAGGAWYNDGDDKNCFFCDATWEMGIAEEKQEHAEGCLLVRARDLLSPKDKE